jgi:hypothetical protein
MLERMQDDTDRELSRYDEAARIKQYSGLSVDTIRGGIVQYDPNKKVDAVYITLPSGGRYRVGDRPVQVAQADTMLTQTDATAAPTALVPTAAPKPVSLRPTAMAAAPQTIAEYDAQLRASSDRAPTAADFEVGGYTAEEFAQYQQSLQGPEMVPMKMTPAQTAEYAKQPRAMIVSDYEAPGLFEGTVSEVVKGLVRGGIVEPAKFVNEMLGDTRSTFFQLVNPKTGEFEPRLMVVSAEEMANIMKMPFAPVGLEDLLKTDEQAGTGAQIAGGVGQFVGAFAGVGKLFKIGKGLLSAATQGAAADFLGFGGNDGRLTDVLLELGVPENRVTDFLRTDPSDPDYVGRFKNALEGAILGGLVDQIAPVFRLIKDGGSATALGQAIGDLRFKAQQTSSNLLSDAIGVGRAVAAGDTRMLGEIFQPAGTPRSLGAAAPTDTPAVTGSSNPLRAGGIENEKARQEIVSLAGQRDPSRPKPFVKLEDIATFYEQNHLAQYGRKLDQSNDQDLDLAVNAASDEVKYQLNQSVSGKGWYDSDVRKTFEIVSRIPGLESLATSETDRVIMSAIMAPTSIGRLVTENTRAAIAAMLGYKRTGRIPTSPPAANTVTEGIQNAGWGFKQGSVASGMQVISHLIDTLGPDGFADWWLSPHSLKELTGVRQAAGLSGAPSGLSGGQDSMHLGAMVIGDKTGKFSLNINGYEGTTKDVWFSRMYNRHFGDMRDSKGELAGGPRNTVERRRMEEFTRKVQGNLQNEGLSEQDIQAVLWYYEQNLTTDLGVLSRPGAFSEEAEKIYGQLRPGVRAGDATQTAAEPAGLEGFRGIGATQRTVRAERRLPERVDPRNPAGQTGPYTRGTGSGDAGDGLLVLEPNPQSKTRYSEAGLSLPVIREVPAQQSAAQYNADMTGAMQGHKFGAQVEIKSAEDLAQARLFRTEDGSGFAIKPDGDIVAVFAGKQSAKGSGYSMLQAAVAAGGRKLDAFDTYLPKIYETVGFRPVARLPWNDEFAPPNWDKETFSKYNNGEPDVVFFVYDPDYYGGAVDVPTFNDYDKAVAEQDRQLQSLEGQK